jgi:nickel-dependent lactate racemase
MTIRYGDRILPVAFPAGCDVDVVGRRVSENIDERLILENALAHPIAAPQFAEFIAGAQSPLIVVNDATRSTPTDAMLASLLPSLGDIPGWRVIVATGLHRAPTEPERQRIFGQQLDTVRDHLLIHDGYDQSCLKQWDSSDGLVQINSALADADRLILLSSVEPHFFAGYTGGRKSIVPGLAGKESVERSHAGAVHAAAAPLRIVGNPVREYIHKNTLFINRARTWSIQAVLDGQDRLAAAFAGDFDKTFEAACGVAQKYYVRAVSEVYDIVVAAVYPPLDVNLYQAQKGWELSHIAVKDNGALVVTSPCTEGVGSPFYAKLSESFPNEGEWVSLAQQPYTMGLHKLVRTGRVRSRIRLMAVTDMPVEEVTKYGYEAFASVDDAISAAVTHVGLPARALVVEDAGLTTITRVEGI